MNEYQSLKKEYLRNPISQNYERDLTQAEKENLFKEAYSVIALFDKMVYEAKHKVSKKG